MPKAQKNTRPLKSNAIPSATRNAKAPKQPSGSRSSKREESANNDADRVSSPRLSKATTDAHDTSTSDLENANNYLILATLSGSANPTINRLLSLPPTITFERLHGVLQIAFGWTNSHMHDFHVELVDDGKKAAFMRRSSCLHICPDPSEIDFPEDLREDTKAESEVTLADVYEKPEWKDKAEIEYEYDHGDGWCHQLSLLGRATPGTNAQFGAPKDVKILCLGGQGHPAAEDAGGIGGWEDTKDAFKHPRKAESRERIEWYKHMCLNGGKSLDPYAFDVLDVNDGLRDAFFPDQSSGKSKAGCGKKL